ncbi:helix-turn-helix transcriptional regulator [Streptomyces synnematoformans]|uniref:HTH cro/C1-type domain-containing protein n=1 Tax=Streptomyces synnematoformans TaxID=415721 RepID=A0ABN2YL27_9ACTN
MSASTARAVGGRVQAARLARKMTQRDLSRISGVSHGMIRAIERGGRKPSDAVVEALAAAMAVDPMRLLHDPGRSAARIHDSLSALSDVIASFDCPDDGAVRPLDQLHQDVAELADWRLSAQYLRIARGAPHLLKELARAVDCSTGAQQRAQAAALLASAYRSADAVAYKHGAKDLSARLVELMRWAAEQADDDLQRAAAAYVRTETFFSAGAHRAGLRALERAVDASPMPDSDNARAARGALHMRAAVIAGRDRNAPAAGQHMAEATGLADRIPEGVYLGTAFGPSSVRVHAVSVAVSLGQDHLKDALDIGRTWKPPARGRGALPAERRSGFYIELARAQLWSGRRDAAYESLKVARRIAPQATREHPWVREDITTLRRLRRADDEDLSAFAAWCGSVG